MTTCHTVLVKCADAGAADRDLLAWMEQVAGSTVTAVAQVHLHRALDVREFYAYFELAHEQEVGASALAQFGAAVRAQPACADGLASIDRLSRRFEAMAASAGRPAPFHYVVEMDPAAGWQDELLRWYDTEHMPGLAGVSGCVRAQRYVNLDGGPFSLACYDLETPDATDSPAWLAVRHTAWSDRVRPQFRNTRRTMFRSVR